VEKVGQKMDMNTEKIIIYTDGGARGNPGPSAIGAVVGDERYAEYIGEATNNVAEYKAVILALTKAKEQLGARAGDSSLEVYSDSELLVNQMNGSYRVKEETLKVLFGVVSRLRTEFRDVSFTHIPREKNAVADALVNEVLDARN
jgi:ribonuclease HI